jgi:hypothetical protein
VKTASAMSCVLLASLVGCSSDGDILPKKTGFQQVTEAGLDADDPVTDAEPDVAGDGRPPRDPNANCVKPGTPNNDRDIGGYCEPGRGDCQSEQGPRFCTADFGELTPIPDNQWFCSSICTMDEECGAGAFCLRGEIGTGCAPPACAVDAGSLAAIYGAGR